MMSTTPTEVATNRPSTWVVVDGERRVEAYRAALPDWIGPGHPRLDHLVAEFGRKLRQLDEVLQATDRRAELRRDVAADVVTFVLRHPGSHDQCSWFYHATGPLSYSTQHLEPVEAAACGTTACVAGWTVLLGSPGCRQVSADMVVFEPQPGVRSRTLVPHAALVVLGVVDHDEHRFTRTPLARWLTNNVFDDYDELRAVHNFAAALDVDVATLAAAPRT